MSDMNPYIKAVKDLDLALQDAGLELTRALLTHLDREVGMLMHAGAKIANDQRVEIERQATELRELHASLAAVRAVLADSSCECERLSEEHEWTTCVGCRACEALYPEAESLPKAAEKPCAS